MPSLVIRRETRWEQVVTRYQVLVDGQDVATILQGEQLVLPLEPGRHEIQVRMGKCSSKPLAISFVEGRNELVECGHDPRPVQGWLARTFFPATALRAKRRTVGF